MSDGLPPLSFRPHHFLCTLGFQGKGYSQEFVTNFQRLADRLRIDENGDDVPIQIVSETDAICAPCPNRRGSACETEAKIQKLDTAHANALGLSIGNTLTWGEAKSLIARRISDETFNRICGPCSWRSLGVCQEALTSLRKTLSSRQAETRSEFP